MDNENECAWRDSRDIFRLLDDIGLEGVLSVGKLIWPDFVEFNGCVFIEWQYKKTQLELFSEELRNNIPEFERLVNHLHLWDIFLQVDDLSSDFNSLGVLLRETWSCTLRQKFPSKQFDVEFYFDEYEYGPTLTFGQRR